MSYPALDFYLSQLARVPEAGARLWLDEQGRARGRFYASTLSSAFQAIRRVSDGGIVGHEGFLRSHSTRDEGLSLWQLLDQAASDAESIELDRLSRTLHALNYFPQVGADGPDLYLSVHGRLLAAVQGDHGRAFGRVLSALGVPQDRIVLQLPASAGTHRWALKFVADNYVRNGFRLLLNVADSKQGLSLLEQAEPEAIKIDGRSLPAEEDLLPLLEAARKRGVKVVFKRVETAKSFASLKRIEKLLATPLLLQGYVWDFPQAAVTGAIAPDVLARAGEVLRSEDEALAAQVGG